MENYTEKVQDAKTAIKVDYIGILAGFIFAFVCFFTEPGIFLFGFIIMAIFTIKMNADKHKLFKIQEPAFMQVRKVRKGMTYNDVKTIMGPYPPTSESNDIVIYKLSGLESYSFWSSTTNEICRTATIIFYEEKVVDVSIDGTRITTTTRHYHTYG